MTTKKNVSKAQEATLPNPDDVLRRMLNTPPQAKRADGLTPEQVEAQKREDAAAKALVKKLVE